MANVNTLLDHMQNIALPIHNLGKDKEQIDQALCDIAECYKQLRRDNVARKFTSKAIEVEQMPSISPRG